VTILEPRGYWNESPAGGSLLEKIKLDSSPMPKYSNPIDRITFQCYVGPNKDDETLALMLKDSGSDVNIINSRMAKKAGLKILACRSRKAMGVNGISFQVDKECWAYFRCGKFVKRIVFIG
jgi:hypothetical protein